MIIQLRGSMSKLLIKILFFFATSVIVILPIFRSFYGLKPHKLHHINCVAKEKCNQLHLTHAAHDNSWNLIKNSQLSSPPVSLKVKTASIIRLLFVISIVSLALTTNRLHLVSSVFKTKSFPTYEIYLVYKILLI